jgi:hypothetical protein
MRSLFTCALLAAIGSAAVPQETNYQLKAEIDMLVQGVQSGSITFERLSQLPGVPYTREEMSDAFNSWVVQNNGMAVGKWKNDPMFSTVHTAYHNYWYSQNLASVYETGEVPAIQKFAETVQNALFVWWMQSGQPRITKAYTLFMGWLANNPTLPAAAEYTEEWIKMTQNDPEF